MLTQSQMWNCKDLMLPNGSIKSVSSIENTFGSMRGIIHNMFTQLSAWDLKNLMLSNRTIQSLSIRKNPPKEKYSNYLNAFVP